MCVYVLTRVHAALSMSSCLTCSLTSFVCPPCTWIYPLVRVCFEWRLYVSVYTYLFIYLHKCNNWIDLSVTDVIQLPAQGQVYKLYCTWVNIVYNSPKNGFKRTGKTEKEPGELSVHTIIHMPIIIYGENELLWRHWTLTCIMSKGKLSRTVPFIFASVLKREETFTTTLQGSSKTTL